jgi:hypothetical protein
MFLNFGQVSQLDVITTHGRFVLMITHQIILQSIFMTKKHGVESISTFEINT